MLGVMGGSGGRGSVKKEGCFAFWLFCLFVCLFVVVVDDDEGGDWGECE